MGCTSSTQNMGSPYMDATDNGSQKTDLNEDLNKNTEIDIGKVESLTDLKEIEQNDEILIEETNELPACDNLDNNEIVKQNIFEIDNNEYNENLNMNTEEHIPVNIEPDDEVKEPSPEIENDQINIKKENSVEEIDINLDDNSDVINKNEISEINTLNTNEDNKMEIDVRTESDNIIIEDSDSLNENDEALSPSPSDSSRATRWEALADIAAELPPELTVDPVTGQIYSLAK